MWIALRQSVLGNALIWIDSVDKLYSVEKIDFHPVWKELVLFCKTMIVFRFMAAYWMKFLSTKEKGEVDIQIDR